MGRGGAMVQRGTNKILTGGTNFEQEKIFVTSDSSVRTGKRDKFIADAKL